MRERAPVRDDSAVRQRALHSMYAGSAPRHLRLGGTPACVPNYLERHLLHGRGVARPCKPARLEDGREPLGGVESREDEARLVRRRHLVHGRGALDRALRHGCSLEVPLLRV